MMHETDRPGPAEAPPPEAVDHAKVARIRQAIAAGDYKIEATSIAEKIVASLSKPVN